MTDLSCKKCGSLLFVKSGHTRGMQRYKCRDCSCQFTRSKRCGVVPELKSLAMVLYSFCGVSMGKIARLFGISTVAALKWVRTESLKPQALDPAPEIRKTALHPLIKCLEIAAKILNQARSYLSAGFYRLKQWPGRFMLEDWQILR